MYIDLNVINYLCSWLLQLTLVSFAKPPQVRYHDNEAAIGFSNNVDSNFKLLPLWKDWALNRLINVHSIEPGGTLRSLKSFTSLSSFQQFSSVL